MIKINFKNKKGFVLLYAVTLAAIFLSLALGVGAIALKENLFSTSAKNTNNAFFAADTGVECALFYDKSGGSGSAFIDLATISPISCNNNSVTVTESPTNVWTFSIPSLGGSNLGCAKVKVDKTSLVSPTTTITADGYNNGGSSGGCAPVKSTAVERELSTSY
jgi:hypothetical protein